MKRNTILIIDDEPEICELLTLFLEAEAYAVISTNKAREAARLLDEHQPSLVILDINLPDEDGLSLCRRIRDESHVPILFISCRSDDEDIIRALGVGGDDYLVKPFNPSQLVARVKAHLRRTYEFAGRRDEDDVIEYEGLRIETAKRRVFVDGQEVVLTNKEYDILVTLARQPEHIFSYEELYSRVWGAPGMGDYRSLMVHIRHLRNKVEADPAHPVYVVNVRGIGYCFRNSPERQAQ